MGWLYGLCILVSLAGIATLDRRFRLAMWNRPKRTLIVVFGMVAGLLAWDVAGISLGIFFRGSGPYQSGLLIGPELPIEELAFLTLLSYLTLVLFLAWQRRFARSRS